MKYYGLKILKDNYIWLLIKNNHAIAIDCGEAQGLLSFIADKKLDLNYILITHHHSDHIDGLYEVKKATGAKVIAGVKTAEIIPGNLIDKTIAKEEDFNLKELVITPIFTPGHSVDHTMYFFQKQKWLFSGDTIFTLACGRPFYNMELLFNSLQKVIKKIPKETLVFPGHDYLSNNLKFLESINYFGFRRKKDDLITIPSTFATELYYNPFLNTNNSEFKSFLNKENFSDLDFFSYLRQLKNKF